MIYSIWLFRKSYLYPFFILANSFIANTNFFIAENGPFYGKDIPFTQALYDQNRRKAHFFKSFVWGRLMNVLKLFCKSEINFSTVQYPFSLLYLFTQIHGHVLLKTGFKSKFSRFLIYNINNHLICFEETINTLKPRAKNSLQTTQIFSFR